MKRIFASLVLAALAFTSVLAAVEDKDTKYVTKAYNYRDFTGLNVSGIVQVNLSKSNTYKVEVTLPEDIVPYLNVSVSGGTLKIGTSNIPSKINNRYRNWTITAEVSMPELRKLEMSGVTKLNSEGLFSTSGRGLKIDLSGVSKATGLNVQDGPLDVDLSGASSLKLSGEFSTANFDMGGASNGTFNFDAVKLNLDLSGAAKANFKGEYDTIDVDASGASAFSLDGSAKKLTAETSGASKVRAQDSPIEDVRINESGASLCEVAPLKYLTIEASGSSSVRYKGNEDLHLDLVSISRSATVSKIR